MTASHITIVGAGHGAGQLVASLRSEGFKGGIRLIGEERHLPYQRPPLSKKFLSGEAGIDAVTLRPREFYDKEGVDLVLGVRAEAIDRTSSTVTLADGRTFEYEALVLATGTRARPIPVPGARLERIQMLRGIDDSLALKELLASPRRVVVVGGGYVGLEVAASAHKLGSRVVVVEALPRLMARVASPELAAYVLGVHRANGVDVRLSTGVKAFQGSGASGVTGVAVEGEVIPADVVIVGIGALPNSEIAAAAGLAVDNGILVDELMQTSDPRILAIGDCACHPSRFTPTGRVRLESVQGAVDQAVTAAKTLTGKREPYDRVPWFWSDQYEERLQMAGLPQPDDATVVRRYPDPRQLAVFRVRGGRLTAVEAVNSGKDYMAGRRLIEMGTPVSPERLADPAVGAKQLLS